MDWKKIGKALLFPHIAVLLLLLPAAIGGMLWAMRTFGDSHPITVAFCALALYATVIWCARIPGIIRRWKHFKGENIYAALWFGNHRLRMNVTLAWSALWNGAYGGLQLGMGIWHHSAWFCSLAAYYVCLAAMRFFIVRYTLHSRPGEDMRQELIHYRTCGWLLLVMNLALSGMMLYMIRENRVTRHHEITTIAMAAYTFFTLTWAIINVFRYRRYNSPAMSASRAVSLAAACVSMLSLENTMLVTFGTGKMTAQTRQMLLTFSGGAILLFILAMAIYMIVTAHQKLREN